MFYSFVCLFSFFLNFFNFSYTAARKIFIRNRKAMVVTSNGNAPSLSRYTTHTTYSTAQHTHVISLPTHPYRFYNTPPSLFFFPPLSPPLPTPLISSPPSSPSLPHSSTPPHSLSVQYVHGPISGAGRLQHTAAEDAERGRGICAA